MIFAVFGRSEVVFFIVKTVCFAKLSAKLIVNHCILTTLLKHLSFRLMFLRNVVTLLGVFEGPVTKSMCFCSVS